MKVCPKMQKVIEEICEKHGLDLRVPHSHSRLTNGDYMPLVIEEAGFRTVSVAHYYTQNGDAMADPDITFFVGYGEWVPVSITQAPVCVYREVSVVGLSEGLRVPEITAMNLDGQNDVGAFAETWADNIREQGWVENGVKDDD